MLRVTRPGSRIGRGNWTPEGFSGRLFWIVGTDLPPRSGAKSPAPWGTAPHIVKLIGAQAMEFRTERKHFNFRYRSPAHSLHVFREQYAPVQKACAARGQC